MKTEDNEIKLNRHCDPTNTPEVCLPLPRPTSSRRDVATSGHGNIVEGSSERNLSRKLNLYDVSKSSGMEALEDFEDILRREELPRWNKDDPRLKKLRQTFEGYPNSSNPPKSSTPSVRKVSEVLGGLEGQEGTEAVVNYLIDLLIRSGYFLDKQMNALEDKHTREGGYNERLLKRRLEYRKNRGQP